MLSRKIVSLPSWSQVTSSPCRSLSNSHGLASWSSMISLPCRSFSTSHCVKSGHSRWSKIKHDKGKNDRAKSKERTGLVLAVIRTSKEGGPDPKLNPALTFAINAAKKAQVAKEAIDKAIAKGQGKSLSGASLDNVLIEAMLPYGVAAIMEGQTDNKTRVMADVKSIVQRAGGAITPTAFSFEKKGKVWFKPNEFVGVDEVMDEAIEAGAEEIMLEEGQLVVETAPEMVTSVGAKLSEVFTLEVDRSHIFYDPKEETLAKIDEEQSIEIQTVLDKLEEIEDLQEIYLNAIS